MFSLAKDQDTTAPAIRLADLSHHGSTVTHDFLEFEAGLMRRHNTYFSLFWFVEFGVEGTASS